MIFCRVPAAGSLKVSTTTGLTSYRDGNVFSRLFLSPQNQKERVAFQNMVNVDEELIKNFQNLKSVKGLYLLLQKFHTGPASFPDYSTFRQILFNQWQDEPYESFKMAKKNGSHRTIEVPKPEIKLLQQSLNTILRGIYEPKASVHGFTIKKNIISNAQNHCGKKYVFNIDLADFFHSITQQRIRGVFMKPPYSLPSKVATAISHLCCYNDRLPQGAPTSPIISNIVCAKLDSGLRLLAKENNCFYTRYADDITFSTTRKNFPTDLGVIYGGGTQDIKIGDKLASILAENGFTVNAAKTRIQINTLRQEVTGLTVNTKVNVSRDYIRHVRAILHDWELNGYVKANSNHWSHCSKKHLRHGNIDDVLGGKLAFIGQVRGNEDLLYKKLLQKYAGLIVNEMARDLALKFDNKLYELWSGVIDQYLEQAVIDYVANENITNEDIKNGFEELKKLKPINGRDYKQRQDPDYNQVGVPVAYTFLYLPRKIMAATAILTHYFGQKNSRIPYNILDIGSGTNAVSIAIGLFLFTDKININLTALEPSHYMRHFCSYQPNFSHLNISYREGMVGEWQDVLHSNYYELIFMSSVLQNSFNDQQDTWWEDRCRELYNCCKNNGTFIIVEPNAKMDLLNSLVNAMQKIGWSFKERLFLSNLLPKVSKNDELIKMQKLTDLKKEYKCDYHNYSVCNWNPNPKYNEIIYIFEK